MSRLSLKNDFKDGEILYGAQINTNNDATVAAVNDNYEEILKLKDIKADVVNVDNQLKTKVDVGTFNDAINSLNDSKADKSVVNQKADKTELANKADLIYVNNELSKKADTSYVNTQLTQKANLSDVNSKLSLKADKATTYTKDEVNTTIDNKIVSKADKTDLNSKADKSSLGDLSQLLTSDKSSAVAAINETIREGVANNIDALSITKSNDNKIQTVGVIDSNAKGYATKTWTGTRNEYNSIQNKNANTLYYIIDDDDEHELVANKVTSISDSSTNIQYPSAKAVNDKIKASAPDLSNYVKNTNYATYDKAGVLRANSSGFNVGTDGIPGAEQYELDNYKSIPNNTFISKGTLENIKDDYVGTSEPVNVLNDNLDNIVPKQTVIDSIININDALKYKTFDFKVDGAYKQTTSDGSNLLDIDYSEFPKDEKELHTELNDDYSFTVTGTKTTTTWSNINFRFKNTIQFKQGVTYYLHDITIYLRATDGSYVRNQRGSSFTAEQDMYCEGSGYWTTNTPGVKNETLRPYLGTVPYDESKYYKYTGGIASPNPDYSQEITPLSFDKIIKIGQNLLPNTFYSKNADCSIDDDGWVSVTFNNSGGTSNQYFNLYYDSAKLKPNKNYNVILEVKELSGTGTVVVCSNAIFGEQKEGQFSTDYRLTFSSLQSGKIYNKICLTKTDLDNIVTSTRSFVQADPGQAGSITFRISILEDTSVTPENFVYQPYQETNYLIDLQGNQMVSLPNGVKDESTIDKEGNVSLVKKVGKFLLNSVDKWNLVGETETYWEYANYHLSDSAKYSYCLSNYFSSDEDNRLIRTLTEVYCRFPKSLGIDVSDSDKFKQWTTNNEVYGYYEKTTPQIINLGKLENLITTEQGSNTFAINGNIDTQISTTYALDLKKYIDNKIATVSTAVIGE